jgi:glycosyltransferase involved in cell wall biosynthesis
MITTRKRVFISWAPYSRRSLALSDELDISSYLVHHLKFQRPFYAPFKYILQTVHTLAILLKERPNIVFVQDPPIFAGLAVYVYTLLVFGQAQYIIDAHTGALLHPWWKPFRGLQKSVYRRALTIITTNQSLADLVESWGANSMALAGPPIKIPPGEAMQFDQAFNLVLVNTFANDEPTHVALDAVADLPDVHLYVTGNVDRAPPSLLERVPPNVTLTGFVPDDEYLKLLRGADAVMVLTEQDFTLQLGAVEAIALGKPIIISNQPFLREYFNQGAVHVPNTPEGVRQGIIRLERNLERLSAEVPELQRMHQEEWSTKSQQLHKLMPTGGTR